MTFQPFNPDLPVRTGWGKARERAERPIVQVPKPKPEPERVYHVRAPKPKAEPDERVYPRGEACPRAKLTEEQVIDMRVQAAEGRSISALAKDYGVSQPVAWNAVHGKSWAHLATLPVRTYRARGEATHSARLTADQARAIRGAKGSGAFACDLARQYGVNADTIRNIWNGRTWKWLGEAEA